MKIFLYAFVGIVVLATAIYFHSTSVSDRQSDKNQTPHEQESVHSGVNQADNSHGQAMGDLPSGQGVRSSDQSVQKTQTASNQPENRVALSPTSGKNSQKMKPLVNPAKNMDSMEIRPFPAANSDSKGNPFLNAGSRDNGDNPFERLKPRDNPFGESDAGDGANPFGEFKPDNGDNPFGSFNPDGADNNPFGGIATDGRKPFDTPDDKKGF